MLGVTDSPVHTAARDRTPLVSVFDGRRSDTVAVDPSAPHCRFPQLERRLAPGRPASSTVAVNRRAQFLPHKDSGGGAGQSTSFIAALGDFTGGELVVEGAVHDVRYRGLEFDGWKQRHWTQPFVGERFSLVWFTPKGCEEGAAEGADAAAAVAH